MADKTVVLIVEDDQNTVDLVRPNLSARGHDVIVSKDSARGHGVIVSKDGAGVSRGWKPGRSTWCCWT